MPNQMLINKDNTLLIASDSIAIFEIEKHGTKYRLIGRHVIDHNETTSLGDFDTLPEAKAFLNAIVRQIEAE